MHFVSQSFSKFHPAFSLVITKWWRLTVFYSHIELLDVLNISCLCLGSYCSIHILIIHSTLIHGNLIFWYFFNKIFWSIKGKRRRNIIPIFLCSSAELDHTGSHWRDGLAVYTFEFPKRWLLAFLQLMKHFK